MSLYIATHIYKHSPNGFVYNSQRTVNGNDWCKYTQLWLCCRRRVVYVVKVIFATLYLKFTITWNKRRIERIDRFIIMAYILKRWNVLNGIPTLLFVMFSAKVKLVLIHANINSQYMHTRRCHQIHEASTNKHKTSILYWGNLFSVTVSSIFIHFVRLLLWMHVLIGRKS